MRYLSLQMLFKYLIDDADKVLSDLDLSLLLGDGPPKKELPTPRASYEVIDRIEPSQDSDDDIIVLPPPPKKIVPLVDLSSGEESVEETITSIIKMLHHILVILVNSL